MPNFKAVYAVNTVLKMEVLKMLTTFAVFVAQTFRAQLIFVKIAVCALNVVCSIPKIKIACVVYA